MTKLLFIMLFNFGLRSSILLIFFFHGIVYAVLLLNKGLKHQHLSSMLLSLFIFLCCLYITPWLLGHAGWYSTQPYRDILFYIPTQHVFLLGPIIYLYTQSLLSKTFRLDSNHLLHFIPGGVYLIYSLVVFLTDKVILNEYFFYADQKDKDLATWYQVSGIVSMVFYLAASLRYYSLYKKLAFEILSFADSVLFNWIKKFLTAFLIMQIARILFLFLYPDWGNFPEKWLYYLIFSGLFYYISIIGYNNTLKSIIPFKVDLFKNQIENSPIDKKTNIESVSEPKIIDESLNQWKTKISDLIKQEKVFKDPKLTLSDIATKLGTNPRIISNAINQGFQMNFNDFINHQRVEAVKEEFNQNTDKEITLLGIAYNCGFNSKATFNRAFKKHTKSSPKDYLAKLTR